MSCANSTTKKGGYYVRPVGLPSSWECCRYCGHVYDPEAAEYKAKIASNSGPNPKQDFLTGDCPDCGE